MTHLPLAFSVHHFISSVGADAGFACIIGLAILVLLYFAQARETSTLRDRADEAEQRAAQLEARLSQVANAARAQAQQAGPRPAPSPIARPLANPTAARTASAGAPAAVGAPAAGAAAAGSAPAVAPAAAAPSAPAGVGAPALTDATHLIPLPAVAASAPSAPVAPAQPPPSPSVPDPVAADGPAPATAAGAAATAVAEAPAELETTGGGNGVRGDTASHPLFDEPEEEPLPRVQLRPGGAQPRPLPPLRQPPPRGSSRARRGLVALITVLAAAAVIAVLLIATSGGGKSNPSGNTTTSNAPSSRHKTKAAKTFNKGAVTVTVLNGTATAGLAAHILTQLGNAGFKQGSATNALNATVTTTSVAYLPGQKAAAQHVAKSLKLPTSSVSPITSSTQSIACPQTSCNVDVVVTIGQDLVGH
jgi:LytR cell envelope-related transcriptional attenuator